MKTKIQTAKLVEYRNSELQATITNIESYSDKKSELLTNIDKINTQIEQAIVKATKAGVINSSIELVEGDVLSSGNRGASRLYLRIIVNINVSIYA